MTMTIPAYRLQLATETRAERAARRQWEGRAIARPAAPAKVESSWLDRNYSTIVDVALAVSTAWLSVAAAIYVFLP